MSETHDDLTVSVRPENKVILTWKVAASLLIGVAMGVGSCFTYANSFREQIRTEERARLTEALRDYVSKLEFSEFRRQDSTEREQQVRQILLAIERLSTKLDDRSRR